ncbi:MAG: YCF48-related protein, partial [Bacteroidota bacterium]|nr:YCF48-related protein [Bacteroidota bacterium]
MRRYPLFLVCLVLCSFQAFAQWKWLNPLPEGNEFFDAFFISRDTGWVVGGNGAVIRTTNGGATWVAQDNPLRPTPFICLSVVFIDTQTGLISANTGALLRTDDAGATWRRLPASGLGIQKLKPAPDGSIWGFGGLGVIARTTDAGLTWRRLPTGITSVVFDVDFPSPGKIVAVCGSGIVLTSTDGGSSWTSKTLPVTTDIVSLSFAGPSNAFAVQRAIYLLRSTDGGETWTDTTFFVNALRTVRFADAQTGWLLSNSPGAVMKTEDGGRSWRQVVVDETFRYTFEQVIIRSAQEAFLVGDGGAMFRTTNGGASWLQLGTAMTRSHVNAVTGISNTHAWVFGERCVHETTDGGATWSVNRADTLSIHTGIALSATRIIAGGTQGEVHVSANGGMNWMTQVLPPRGRIEHFHFVDAATGWLAGNHGTVAKTTNGGSVWFYTDPGVTHDFHAVFARSADEAWIAGSGGKVYHTTDGGVTWDDRSPNTTSNLLAVHFISATTGWVGGQMVLYQTTDGGRTWEQRSLPGLDVVYDIVFLDAYRGFVVLSRGIAWTNDGGWTFYRVDYPSTGLHDIDVESDGTLWLAGDFGVVQSYTPTPVIAITPASLDFGDVSINRTKDLPLTIDNTGERTMRISNVAALGTGFTLLSLQSDTIPPGGRTGAYVRFAPADTGVVFGLLTVLSNAGLGEPAVELRGRGVPPGESALVHWPDTLDIGVIVLGNIAAGEVHIRNRGQRNLRINDERIVGKDSMMFQV